MTDAQRVGSSPDLTIVVPSHNRPGYLRRLLCFLGGLGNPFPVHILDASSPEILAANRELAQRSGPAVQFFPHPEESHFNLRIARHLDNLASEYVVLCPDDDLIIPSSAARCATFLGENPGYSAAGGEWLCLHYKPDNRTASMKMFLTDDLPYAFHLNQTSFAERFFRMMAHTWSGCPPLFYAVRRTAQARYIFSHVRDTMKYSSCELTSNMFTLLLGNAKVIPGLFGFRDYSSEATRDPIRDDPQHYFTTEDIEYIRRVFKPKLMEVEGVPEEIADYVTGQTARLIQPDEQSGGRRAPGNKWSARVQRVNAVAQSRLLLLNPKLLAAIKEIDPQVMHQLRECQKQLFV